MRSAAFEWLLRTASGVCTADASAVADEGVGGGFGCRDCLFGGGWVYGWPETAVVTGTDAHRHGDPSFRDESLETGVSWLFPRVFQTQ